MRILKIAVLTGLCLVLQGCSYHYPLFVVNESGAAIEVYYTLTKPDFNGDGTLHINDTPKIIELQKFKDRVQDDQWRALDPSNYIFDKDTVTFSLTLPAKTVLRMTVMADYERSEREDFPLKRIRLNGANGRVLLDGDQLRNEFLAESRYKIIYQGSKGD